MPESRVAYQCECGKRWSLTTGEAGIDKKMKCKCGRTIVVYRGFIYSTKKLTNKLS